MISLLPQNVRVMNIQVERLTNDQWIRLKQLRFAALRDSPQAFSTTIEVMESWSDDNWQDQVVNLPTFVAKIDATYVGIVRGEAILPNKEARLISMWVSPNERGKHVGEHLVQAVIAWARDAGYTRLILDVVDDNSAAIALYERLNFQPTGEISAFQPPRSHITEHRRALTL